MGADGIQRSYPDYRLLPIRPTEGDGTSPMKARLFDLLLVSDQI
jgi:hypothetical protein